MYSFGQTDMHVLNLFHSIFVENVIVLEIKKKKKNAAKLGLYSGIIVKME